MLRDLTDDEASVRGCVVKGLTAADIRFLDTFEGEVSAIFPKRLSSEAELISSV